MDEGILDYIENTKGPIYMTAQGVVEEMIEFHHHMATHVTCGHTDADMVKHLHRAMEEFWKRVVVEVPVWTENGMLRYITELLRKNEGYHLQLVKDPDVSTEQVST
jgi:hypothetical protein